MQSFNRPNLKYELKVKKQSSINDEIVTVIKQKFTGQSGIIYCLSRSAFLLSLLQVSHAKWFLPHDAMLARY